MQRRATTLRPAGKAAVAGGLARQSGITFEAAILRVNAWYDQRGEAAIEKVNAPTAGWGDSLRVLTSTVDFFGTYTLHVGGIGIAFDTKSLTGHAHFGLQHLPNGKDAAKHRTRFLAQVAYLKGLRDRHRYNAFFLLYDRDLDMVLLCDQLDALGAGESVAVRTIGRGSGSSLERCTPHLPFIQHANLLALAAAPRPDGRPHLDYLSLLYR